VEEVAEFGGLRHGWRVGRRVGISGWRVGCHRPGVPSRRGAARLQSGMTASEVSDVNSEQTGLFTAPELGSPGPVCWRNAGLRRVGAWPLRDARYGTVRLGRLQTELWRRYAVTERIGGYGG
jgi:hypothetical protein